ncbi:MAG TPA: hypothetical protein VM095_04895 [Pyrinomonadaceae bacterium]|nr:hypothetical protein [Pyrinomonadaceae bacterium]
MKLAKVILLILSACALIAGCSKGGNTNNANKTGNTSGAVNTAAASPKANAEASKSPTETVGSAGKVSKPEDAAQGLFAAWKTKDRTEAAKFATNDAISQLYSEGGPVGLQFQGCDKQGDGNYVCGYSYEGGGLMMTVEGNATDGYKVTSTAFVAD